MQEGATGTLLILKTSRAELGARGRGGFYPRGFHHVYPRGRNAGVQLVRCGGEGTQSATNSRVTHTPIQGPVRDAQNHIPTGQTGRLKLPTAASTSDYVQGQDQRWKGSGPPLKPPRGHQTTFKTQELRPQDSTLTLAGRPVTPALRELHVPEGSISTSVPRFHQGLHFPKGTALAGRKMEATGAEAGGERKATQEARVRGGGGQRIGLRFPAALCVQSVRRVTVLSGRWRRRRRLRRGAAEGARGARRLEQR